jgi:hypothetical protein
MHRPIAFATHWFDVPSATGSKGAPSAGQVNGSV